MSVDYSVCGDEVINKKLTYSIHEAAKVLGVSSAKMYQIARIKGFPSIIIGKRILVSIKGLEEWVEDQAKKNSW